MSLDSQISQCNVKIEKYKALKIKLNNVLNYLSSSKDAANDLKSKLSNLYQINDDDSNVQRRASNLALNIETVCKNINNVIIPAIDSTINNIYKQKDNLKVLKQKEEAAQVS